MMRRFVAVVLAACLCTVGGQILTPTSAEHPAGANRVRPAIDESLVKRITDGRGKLAVADVRTMIGPPDSVEIPVAPLDGDIGMVWEDVAIIRVEFKDNKANKITGRFSDLWKTKKVSLDNFQKLKMSMTLKDIQNVLSGQSQEREWKGGPKEVIWSRHNRLTVYFREGKITGHSWDVADE